MSGWIASSDPAADIDVTVNGRSCDSTKFQGETAALKQVFPFHQHATRFGFRAWSRITGGADHAEVAVVDRRSGVPLGEWQTMFVPLVPERHPIPDARRRQRVHGSTDELSFLLAGYSNAQNIDRALKATTDRSLSQFSDILDWGCGCGRLTRYLLDGKACVTGADIDGDSLSWCRVNLPGAHFVQLELYPPSALPTAGYDLVAAISVFTHLSETVQFEWLSELDRVLAPNGVVVASIHGPTAHAMTGSPAISRRIDRAGLLDAPSYDLSGVIVDGYYRTTHHTHEYIRSQWSKVFDVLAILPACIANVQDLVVMRKLTGRH
jgi:SAM-dependent methyltransferase